MSARVYSKQRRNFTLLFVCVVPLLILRGRAYEAEANEVRIYRDNICGPRGVSLGERIGFGYVAEESEWPWHGALLYGNDYKCGCTLISEWFVLTAAHCVVNPETGNKLSVRILRVVLGLHDLSQHKSHTRTHNVKQINVHPQFVTSNLKHDVALLLLDGRIKFNQFVQPIGMNFNESPWIEHLAGTFGTVVGWGFTEEDTISKALVAAHMPIVRYTDCVESNPDLFGRLIHSGMFCAGAQNGTSVCNGDSGGGMYIYQNNRWYLRGVVSFAAVRDGTNLCDLYNYAAFVNVPHYGKWIQQQLAEQDEKIKLDSNAVEDPVAIQFRVDANDTSSENATTTSGELIAHKQQPPPESSTTVAYIPPIPETIQSAEIVPAECLQQHNRLITVERESSISLHCNHNFSGKVHSIRWFRENKYHQYVDLSAEFGLGEDSPHDILTLRHLDSHHSGRYFCRVQAEQGVHMDNRTLAVTGVIPRFMHGNVPSFLKFHLSLKSDYFNLKVSFRAERKSGVLFHKANDCGKQLMSLALIDGRPEFRYRTRSDGIRNLTNPEHSIRLGQWHTIQISALRGRGHFSLDDRLLVLFQDGMLNSDCAFESVWLGGIPNDNTIAGFTGCVSHMSLNDISIDFWKESVGSQGITQCEPCSPDPCSTGGICIETVENEGYNCLCKPGFVGKHCTKVGESCSYKTCVQGYCIENANGFQCYCPPSNTGKRCERENQVDSDAIAFNTFGFALYGSASPRAASSAASLLICSKIIVIPAISWRS
ncbi:uncharacterized protein LOC129768244 isoform X2 [Toxorhynchites rutilus septentrionalis]|uniref:uncharacterized protein LOC129768244 isoform X2 n=1 Tax=Toxorhynchites rutilus septentrionalis TaxID=329112 RepID=UPI00247B001C|nr:uncharacterized protein LOC129768244 isoform X2 [Toxorhynchites rutilus septentrionalis]